LSPFVYHWRRARIKRKTWARQSVEQSLENLCHGERGAPKVRQISGSTQPTCSGRSGGLGHLQAVAFEQATHIVGFEHLVLNQLLSVRGPGGQRRPVCVDKEELEGRILGPISSIRSPAPEVPCGNRCKWHIPRRKDGLELNRLSVLNYLTERGHNRHTEHPLRKL